ncbi:MAG: 3'-5' exonuclease, partial [Pseudomonadota bacterium]
LTETKSALAEAVERETTRLAIENARLQALLADVPAGVLLCAPDHQIVFYNGPAAALLTAEHAPGLDRSLLDYLNPAPVRAAYERLSLPERAGTATDLLCATTQSGDVLAGRMRLLDLPQGRGDRPGYVLTLRDVTADLALHAGREALLEEVFERVRRPAANLQTVLAAGSARGAEGRAALLAEVEGLATTITDLGARYDAARGGWWPMADTRAGELAEAVATQAGQAGIALAVEAGDLRLQCDAFQLVALLSHLAERLVGEHEAHGLSLQVAAEEGGALLSLSWTGPVLPVARLEAWLGRPLEVGLADTTGRSVLAAHGTEVWPEPGPRETEARLCVPLALSAVGAPAGASETRRAVYDFDLLDRDPPGALAETPLTALTCIVFDTETTGLLPSSGDEIVQIAAMRILGGRVVEGEAFETLVNPGRSIPAVSTEVHGITEAMVADAPPIDVAARRFHAFAEGAVLVAHNAPFDLEFLRRHEAGIGARFDHPVLDTVLLSAVVFGQAQTHTLDALTDRLGITIPPEARHTAMGDTIATAAALEKLIPMLAGQGITTFGEAIAACRRHARLLKDVNDPERVPA